MTPDANQIGQEERRRGQFAKWLVRAWEWAGDNALPLLAEQIEELAAHSSESDYPLWFEAERIGLIGKGGIADILRELLGVPVMGPKATGWEREINFSPIIALDASVFDSIYSAMGWANRTLDTRMKRECFYLWSPTGNVVRFIKKGVVLDE